MYDDDDDYSSSDENEECDKEVYKLISKVALLSLNEILNKKTDCVNKQEKNLFYNIEKILNDMPDNYFNIKTDKMEEMRELYLKDFVLTKAKISSTKKKLESNIKSGKKTVENGNNMCVFDALTYAMIHKTTYNVDDFDSSNIKYCLDNSFKNVLEKYKDILVNLAVDDFSTLVRKNYQKESWKIKKWHMC